MLPTQKTIESYYIYVYTFLDDLSFIRDPFKYFQYDDTQEIKDAIHLISEKFKNYGWEGDGEIGIIWLPPFIDIGIHDTHGNFIWHVKQSNNGISFLACDTPLDFDRLREQNQALTVSEARDGLIPISIIETDVQNFTKQVENVRSNLNKAVLFLSDNTPAEIADTIKQDLTTYNQGLLICYFQEFLDESYLRILVQAIQGGNPYKITLRKSKVRIDASNYLPELDDCPDIDSSETFFTIHGLISDMWKAYKREPFKDKVDMLFSSLGYKVDTGQFYEIRKHVVLRNCIQHHGGTLDREALKQLGREQVELKVAQGLCNIEVWKPIIIAEEELFYLCDILLQFVENFHSYVKNRVPVSVYMFDPTRHGA